MEGNAGSPGALTLHVKFPLPGSRAFGLCLLLPSLYLPIPRSGSSLASCPALKCYLPLSPFRAHSTKHILAMCCSYPGLGLRHGRVGWILDLLTSPEQPGMCVYGTHTGRYLFPAGFQKHAPCRGAVFFLPNIMFNCSRLID